ncbi:MAG: phospho-N-acetylmuramoyl-pentapeptide-transferase [Gaiellaceae bacterium]
MVRVLVAGIVAMMISIIIGPRFIEFLRRHEFGQQIRVEGPAGHFIKQGTPVLGGVLVLVAAIAPFLALSHYTAQALTVLFLVLACASIGFIDDLMKVRHRRSLGLTGRWKMLLLTLITVVTGYLAHRIGQPHWIGIPIAEHRIQLGWLWYVLLFFLIAGSANAVNLTDGLDGLAAGTGTIALFTFMAMAVISYVRSSTIPAHREPHIIDLAILAAALIGGLIGFLWYNAFPAEVFMGDTGAMAIGGALAGFAIMTKTELLLLLIAGIFVVEALSVMIQVFTFKYMGRRVFLMAPIHHHFEMKAWSETKIMVRFWILCGIFCAAAFALYYRYFLLFRFRS